MADSLSVPSFEGEKCALPSHFFCVETFQSIKFTHYNKMFEFFVWGFTVFLNVLLI